MPRRRGLRPRLLAAVVRLNATSAFAAERQVVGQTVRIEPGRAQEVGGGAGTHSGARRAFATRSGS